MTETGTFIINGTERVVVSQLHRSPGVFFDHDKGKTHSRGKLLYSRARHPVPRLVARLRVRPQGHHLRPHRPPPEDARDGAAARARLLAPRSSSTTSTPPRPSSSRRAASTRRASSTSSSPGQRATRDIKIRSGEVIVKKNTQVHQARRSSKLQGGEARSPADRASRSSSARSRAHDVVDEETGEVLLECNEELTEAKLDELRERGIDEFKILFIDGLNVGRYLRDTLLADKVQDDRRRDHGDLPAPAPGRSADARDGEDPVQQPVLQPRALRPLEGRPPEAELQVLQTRREPLDDRRSSRKRDILETVRHLIELKNGRGSVDDIDHLGNRRVRAVGELMENQYRIGLVRMERAIKERMSMSQEIDTLMPHDLINAKPVSRGREGVLRLARSSRSSWTRRTRSPRSRTSVASRRSGRAVSPASARASRSATFTPTHYGRICPIETPEGPNIGLIASLSTFARVNEYGFVETPYRKVERRQGHRRGRVLLGARGRGQVHRPGQRADVDKKGKFSERPRLVRASTATSSMVTPERSS